MKNIPVLQKGEIMNCEKYVSKFIDHLKACDYSEQTIKDYRCD
jgi:hypothetical protein